MYSNQKTKENMLFEPPTVYLGDYRKPDLHAPVATCYKAKPRCKMRRPPPLRDVHTMSDWKIAAIPFDLLHRPRPIVGTNPWKKQEPHTEPPDLHREEAQATRPRLVMTPAVSLDDIEPTVRKLLVDDVYKTTVMKMHLESGVTQGGSVRAPLPDLPAPANPIYLEKLKAPYVSPEWRMDSVAWDNRQLRTYCDATKEFWTARNTPCKICEDTAARQAQAKTMRKAKRH